MTYTYKKVGGKFLLCHESQIWFPVIPSGGGESSKVVYYIWKGPVLSDKPIGFKESFEWPISPKYWERHEVAWGQMPQEMQDSASQHGGEK